MAYLDRVAAKSGIPLSLWRANTELLTNDDPDGNYEWGEAEHPLYDCLGWEYHRFWKNKPHEFGIAITGADGQVWQVILPSEDDHRGYQYMAPKGVGNRVLFPSLSQSDIARVCAAQSIPIDRVDVQNPWDSFKRLGAVLTVTEGAKKALSLLTQGLLPASVYGQTCLNAPELKGWKNIDLALDMDTGLTSKGEDKAEISRRAKLRGAYILRKQGSRVRFILWDVEHGKGVDDLLVQNPDKFAESFASPRDRIPRHWKELTAVDVSIEQQFLAVDISHLRTKCLAIRSRKGTGKSQWAEGFLRPKIAEGLKVLGLTHRISLGQACGDRWGLPWISEDRGLGQGMICIHSLHSACKARFNPESWKGAIVVIDEATQVFREAVHGADSLIRNRAEILENIKYVCVNAKLLVLLDADLDDATIDLINSWGIECTVIENTYRPEKPYPVSTADSPQALLEGLLSSLSNGEKSLVLCDSQKNELSGITKKGKKAGGRYSTQAIEKRINRDFPHLKTLRVDAETLGDSTHPAYQCLRYEDGVIRLAKLCRLYDAIVTSPSINTGIDLSGLEGHFSAAWGFFTGGVLSPSDVSQFLARLRDNNCPRNIFIKKGFNRALRSGNGSTNHHDLIKGCKAGLRASLEELSQAGERSTIDASWLDYWGRTGATGNAQSIAYVESCKEWLANEGHYPQTGVVYAEDDGGCQAEIALSIAEERALAIRDADDLTDSAAQALDRKESLSRGERAALDKHRLSSAYGQQVTEELQILDKVFGYSPLRLGWYLNNITQAQEDDRRLGIESGDNAWLPSLSRRAVSGKVQTLISIGVPELLRRDEFTQNDLDDWFTTCLRYKDQIADLFGIRVSTKTRPVALARELGKRVGRSLAVVRRSGNDRFYKFAPLSPLLQDVYRYWDNDAKCTELATKCVIRGYIDLSISSNDAKTQNQNPNDAIQNPSQLPGAVRVTGGTWQGLSGLIESTYEVFGETRAWVSTEMGSKSVPLHFLVAA